MYGYATSSSSPHGLRSRFSGGSEYQTPVMDMCHFLEVDFVGPNKWDLLMRLPDFRVCVREGVNGTQQVRTG